MFQLQDKIKTKTFNLICILSNLSLFLYFEIFVQLFKFVGGECQFHTCQYNREWGAT